MSDCKCKSCDRYKRLDAALESLPKSKAKEIRDIYEELDMNYEADSMDLAWHKGIIDGSWPSAKDMRKAWINKWESEK